MLSEIPKYGAEVPVNLLKRVFIKRHPSNWFILARFEKVKIHHGLIVIFILARHETHLLDVLRVLE